MQSEDVSISMQTVSSQSSKRGERVEPPAGSDLWNSFINNTTLHGIRYVFRKRYKFLRVLWLLVILSFFGSFGTIVYNAVMKYLSYPVTTTITQTYERDMAFPAVTICPKNMFQRRKLSVRESDPEFYKLGLNSSILCDATATVRAGRPCGYALLCCFTFIPGIDTSSVTPNCTKVYRTELMKSLSDSGLYRAASEVLRTYGSNMDDILGPYCSSAGVRCTPRDFTPMFIEWGRCFTFNSGGGNEIIRTSEIQPTKLSMVLDTQTDEYVEGKLSQGFEVFVHEKGQHIGAMFGTLVGPGAHVSIAVSKQTVMQLQFT